jgi:peptidoglycan hydrolase-like protein with peptidoglycan-binding domain
MAVNRYLRTGNPGVRMRAANGTFLPISKGAGTPTFFSPTITSSEEGDPNRKFADIHVVVNKKGGKVKKYQTGKTLPHITDYDAAAKEHGFNSRDEVRAWQQQQGLKVDGLFGDESRARYLALKEEENRAKEEESKTPTYEQWLEERGSENINGFSDQEL